MALSLPTITAAIAGLSISGVRVLDLDDIPDATFAPGVPCLFPDPAFLSSASGTAITFRPRKYQVERDVRYVYLHAECGSLRLANVMPALVAASDSIISALLGLEGGNAYHVNGVSIGGFGALSDPTGKQFWGFQVTVALTEVV